jgi:catechol 2,3-dioxygenase
MTDRTWDSTRLPDATRVGPVRLQVADLDRSIRFYETVLGLSLMGSEPSRPAQEGGDGGAATQGRRASLGPREGDRVLVELVERPGVAPADPRRPRLGLYHFAILLPDRPSLGRFLRHASELDIRPGAGDHLVSEALYLSDPDGLGIEVYADRPRTSWQRRQGELVMATDPVDFEDLLAAAGATAWQGMPRDSVMGHVHLHVGDLGEARAFYVDGVGFDVTTQRYPGALFMAAGGYHHHLGANTWARSAAEPSHGDARLLEWTLEVPSGEDVAAVRRRLQESGGTIGTGGDDVVATDPWGTPVRIRPI